MVVAKENEEAIKQSKITARDLRSTGAQNIDDTVMYDPSVDVASDNMRSGHMGYNIRGIRNDRVQMTIDGITLPTSFTDEMGRGVNRLKPASLGSDTVETDTLRQIDIDKTADSATYGAGGIGGTVSMSTYNPSDFVNKDKPFYAALKYGYRSTYRSHGETATLAGYSPNAEALLMLTRRDGHEASNFAEVDKDGAEKTVSNKQTFYVNNILAKVNLGNEIHKVETTAEYFVRNAATLRNENLSSVSGPGYGGTILTKATPTSTSKDKFSRKRVDIAYRYLPRNSNIQEFNIRGYWQDFTTNDRTHSLNTQRRTDNRGLDEHTYNNNLYRQRTYGIRSELTASFSTGSIPHLLKTGAEYRQNLFMRHLHSDYTKNGVGLTTTTGQEQEDLRLFPKSITHTYTVFIQDQIGLTDKLTLTPALRYQVDQLKFKHSKEDTSNTATILQDRLKAQDKSYRHLLPSLKLNFAFNDNWALFAGYAYAVKVPNPQYIGYGLEIPVATLKYRINSNPNLKEEKAHNFEFGMLYNSERFRARLNGFSNLYKDFVSGDSINPPCTGCYAERIYTNKFRARSYGVELATSWKVADHWRLLNSLAYMRGYTYNNGVKARMDTAHPLNGVTGIEYENEVFNIGTKLRWATKKTSVSSDTYFRAPGYGVWDLTIGYRPIKNVEINAGVFNVFNKKYWTSGDVAGVVNDKLVDRYTQPGRNYMLNLELKF